MWENIFSDTKNFVSLSTIDQFFREQAMPQNEKTKKFKKTQEINSKGKKNKKIKKNKDQYWWGLYSQSKRPKVVENKGRIKGKKE